MITAQRARELVESSEVELQKHLDAISEIIESYAATGTRSFKLDQMYNRVFPSTNDSYSKPSMSSPIQILIIRALERNGFHVKLVQEMHHFGGGFGSMEDPYDEMRWHIQVSW